MDPARDPASGRPRLGSGSLVVLHLVEPVEKHWGILEELGTAGVVMRGLNLSSFRDWMASVADGDPPAIAPSTVFFPLRRIERLFLDEPQAGALSLAQQFEQRVGAPAADHLR